MTDQNQSSERGELSQEFLRLLGQHERGLQAYVLAMVPNWNDADDIMQEVRIRLWEQFEAYDSTKDYGNWARTIARYQVLTFREKCSRDKMLFVPEFFDAISEESAVASGEFEIRRGAIATCVQKLTSVKRKLLMRYYSGTKTMRELADEQGKSFNSVRHSIPRIRRQVANCVEAVMRKESQE